MAYQRYADIRDSVKDGNLVFFEATTLGQKFITWIIGGKYSHTGIACWMQDAAGTKKLFVVEAVEGGRRLVNLAAYGYRAFRIVDVGLNWNCVSDSCLDNTGIIKYGYFDFVLLGIKKVFRAKIKDESTSQVCSEFVAQTLLAASGYNVDGYVDPDSLFEQIQPYVIGYVDVAANTTDVNVAAVTEVQSDPACPVA